MQVAITGIICIQWRRSVIQIEHPGNVVIAMARGHWAGSGVLLVRCMVPVLKNKNDEEQSDLISIMVTKIYKRLKYRKNAKNLLAP
jgi:hypothetical protein